MVHLSGKKIAKSHSTITKDSNIILKNLIKNQSIKKIVTGEIKVIKSGPKKIKITTITSGLKIMVRGTNARQIIYIYTENSNEIAQEIQKTWNKYHS